MVEPINTAPIHYSERFGPCLIWCTDDEVFYWEIAIWSGEQWRRPDGRPDDAGDILYPVYWHPLPPDPVEEKGAVS
jgi:hypothetical protein